MNLKFWKWFESEPELCKGESNIVILNYTIVDRYMPTEVRYHEAELTFYPTIRSGERIYSGSQKADNHIKNLLTDDQGISYDDEQDPSKKHHTLTKNVYDIQSKCYDVDIEYTAIKHFDDTYLYDLEIVNNPLNENENTNEN